MSFYFFDMCNRIVLGNLFIWYSSDIYDIMINYAVYKVIFQIKYYNMQTSPSVNSHSYGRIKWYACMHVLFDELYILRGTISAKKSWCDRYKCMS